MAKSVDDLIEFLLEQIAISGSRGLTINEIAKFTTSFYNTTDNVADISTSNVTVDRRLLERIWTWLGRHPDVSIGDDKRYNQSSLAQVALKFPGYIDGNLDDTVRSMDHIPDPTTLENASDKSKSRPGRQRTRPVEGPKFRITEARIYQAICGHLPDITKVGPMEFDLLSHIAVTRSEGILQGELVRVSGQDKRSVPKRTDALQKKGYILKEVVYQRGMRTSRLISKKFATPATTQSNKAERGSSVRDAVRRIFDVLSDQPLVPQTTLAEALNLQSPAGSTVLLRIIRRLERLKCVKRVRTATGPAATSGDLQNYVQLLRSLEPKDLEEFGTDALSLDQDIQQLSAQFESEAPVHSPALAGEYEGHTEEEQTVRHLARWNPDRLMPNVVHDAACISGREGLTNSASRRLITGLFVRRTMESLLMRVSCKSLILQPAHLRHLAIIRTVTLNDGIAQFIHYTWQTFRELVDENGLDISQIPGAKQALTPRDHNLSDAKSDGEHLEAVKTDGFGFHPQVSLPLQVRNGEADFSALVKTTAAEDVPPRNGEAMVIKQADGSLAVTLRQNLPREAEVKRSDQQRRPSTPKIQVPRKAPETAPVDGAVKGRPRKYMRGTESFWRRMFKQVRSDAGMPLKSGETGIMKDPLGLDLYARRPNNFDETLVEAIAAGLPVPHLPEHINAAWVTWTREILERSSEGLYITPGGLRHDSTKQKSQILILRSSRLNKVDLHDRTRLHSFRLISSSAAHSFAFRRYYPPPPPKQSSESAATKDKNKESRRRAKSTNRAGPPVGVFYEEPMPVTSSSTRSRPDHVTDVPLNALAETTDEEPELSTNTGHQHTSGSLRSTSSSPTSNQVRLIQLFTRETAQEDKQASEEVRTRPLPSSLGSGSVTASAPARSSKQQRKLTQKADKLVNPAAGSSFPPLAQTPPSLGERTDDEAENRMAIGNGGRSQPVEHDNPSKQRATQESAFPRQSIEVIIEVQRNPAELRSETERAPSTTDEGRRAGEQAPAQQDGAKPTGSVEATDRAHLTATDGQAPASAHHMTLPNESFPTFDAEADTANTATAQAPIAKKSTSQKKRRREESASASETFGTPRKREKHSGSRQLSSAMCRKVVLQLISETSGVVPNDPFTIKRICAPRWQEAGQDDRPLLKTIKNAIKSLCEQRKLRQIVFSFRGKNGIMLKRAVLFLPTISPDAPLVQDTKQKMIDAEPTDYIPPEWRDEGNRIPLVGRKAQSTISDDEGTPRKRRRTSSVATDISVAGRIMSTPRKGRSSFAASDAAAESPTTARSTRSMSEASPEPPPVETPATGFLTLKVPRLGSLPAVQIFNWRTETPVTALRFNTFAVNSWNPASAEAPRPGRKPRKPPNRSAGRTVVWATERSQSFPSSLQDILSLPDLKVRTEDVLSDDAEWQRFACEVEGVRAWEEQETGAANAKRSTYAFINHTVPAALYASAIRPERTTFANIVGFDQNHTEVETPYPPTESWPVFVSALQAAPEEMERIVGATPLETTNTPDNHIQGQASSEPTTRRSTRAPRRKAVVDEFGLGPHPKRQKRGAGTARAGPGRRRTLTTLTGAPKRLSRSAQYLRTMPEETIYRIVISVVVVRTLAGGIEGYIDWPFVMTMFPDQDQDFIKARWKTLSKRYAHDIHGLTESLQWKYLDGFEAGEVPSVNFQNLKDTDWPGIVDWALKKLDKFATKEIDDLPATREEVLNTNTLTFFEPRPYHNLLAYGAVITNPGKEDLVSSLVFGGAHMATKDTNLHYRAHFEVEISDPQVHLAKSWVFAIVLTPESAFVPSLAQTKLSSLAAATDTCEALVYRALKLLQDEKLIQRSVKARHSDQLSTLRTWEASRRLYERFEERRSINAQMLRRATRYKLDVIDAAFARGESVLFEKDGIVDDGVMVAVFNLMAMGLVRPKPGADVPRTRYGLDWENIGYRTKSMDKKVLNFGVEIVPTTQYVPGDPMSVERKTPIPRGRADEPDGLIPPWIDIHGTVQTGLWEMFVAGVIGLVAQMPGISAREVSRALTFALDEGEVELIMQWCVQTGFAKMEGRSGGYETTEFWWWCISRGSEDAWE